ncbi:hypothetical protein HMPREF9406_3869 [Clostridium sp. HGF2]|nr:hypothetical protein HMPREF9406_3869 [Clostridium sp. HGF2]EQJ55194.1 hypothetical protein QSI_2667 [Clostridioides difficile P28]
MIAGGRDISVYSCQHAIERKMCMLCAVSYEIHLYNENFPQRV